MDKRTNYSSWPDDERIVGQKKSEKCRASWYSAGLNDLKKIHVNKVKDKLI